MKALSMYVWSLVVIMMMGFTSCGDDDELQFSEEQLAYINKNKEYIWEKKAEKDENGELKYKQVVIGGELVVTFTDYAGIKTQATIEYKK